MTTDETTVETTETENIDNSVPQRTVRELIKLDTYQGMTDVEIESIVEYYKEVARNDETVRTEQITYIQQMNEWCAYYDKAANEANDILKKVLAAPLELATIEMETDSGEVDNE